MPRRVFAAGVVGQHGLEDGGVDTHRREEDGVNGFHELLPIPAGPVSLSAEITVPEQAPGIVLFAHGSGSSRLSPRNVAVAQRLNDAGLGTVLVDLLTHSEERKDAVTGEYRFNIGLLADRLTAITDWLVDHDTTTGRGIGLFGASTGAAAALITAAARPVEVQAVVSRGGRPDLAGEAVRLVHQPTLLIVGELDPDVVELNKATMARMPGTARLEIVRAATHLFQEPGALDRVAELTQQWFLQHLKPLPRHVHDPALG
jgi:pimeloyl-ACP methyl ester carboxylesterase